MSQGPLVQPLAQKRVLICVGSGGVGKTTVAATLALRAAVEGRSTLVCTIDPAKRLANSLGLSELGNAEMRISEDILRAAGLAAKAPLRAMMLDMKQAWDEMVIRLAPADKREKILGNRLYKSLSTALAGSQEYIALEKLWELRNERDYALIVLDTPPTAHALDFLDAPNRVLDFLDNEAAKFLLTPALLAGKVGLQLLNLGGSYVTKTLSKFTGVELLQELASLLLAMSTVNEDIRIGVREVRQMLASDQTSFVLVTGAAPERLDEAIQFHTVLKQNHLAVAAIVVNRVHAPPSPRALDAARGLPEGLRERVEQTLGEARNLAEQDSAGIRELARQCEGTPLIEVPRFEVDVHDLSALWQTSRYLLGEVALPS